MKIEDAIKRYESWAEDDRIDVRIRKEHRQIADWLKELKADRPQGEWIYCEDDKGQDGYRCSECGFFVPWYYSYEDIEYIKKYHICPNCGARMKGENDETAT